MLRRVQGYRLDLGRSFSRDTDSRVELGSINLNEAILILLCSDGERKVEARSALANRVTILLCRERRITTRTRRALFFENFN